MPSSQSKLSLKKPCSIPTWYIDVTEPKINSNRIIDSIIFSHLLVKIKNEINIIDPMYGIRSILQRLQGS